MNIHNINDKELVEYITQMYKDGKYYDIIDLLTNDILSSRNNSELFLRRGMAYCMIYENSKAIADLEKSIELNSKSALAYFTIGKSYSNKDDYNNALKYYDKAIEIDNNYTSAYYNRAIVWFDKQNYQNAIKDIDKTLSLEPEAQDAYLTRGIILIEQKEYDKAIKDLSKAIKMKPNDDDALVHRGSAYGYKNELEHALSDFQAAIEINPKNSRAWHNIGSIYSNKKDYNTAVEYYEKAILINPYEPLNYNNKGITLGKQGKYKEALGEFDKALGLDHTNRIATIYKNQTLAILGKKSEIYTLESAYDIINHLVSILPIDDRSIILDKTYDIYKNHIDKILEYSFIDRESDIEYQNEDGSKSKYLVHYTNLEVADKLITEERNSKFRYYNAAYMNDPQEGHIIFDFFNSPNDKSIEKAFTQGKTTEEPWNHFYIGSFLPANQHEDELVMWRMYGKDKHNNEASGCSIIVDASFFKILRERTEKNKQGFSRNYSYLLHMQQETLFRVIYFNNETNEFICNKGTSKMISKDLKELKKELKALIHLKNTNPNKQKDEVINKVVYYLLSSFRYIFKSINYVQENEIRIIQNRKPTSTFVLVDTETSNLPRKQYVESMRDMRPFIKKVILGPKIEKPNQWLYLDTIMKKKGINDFCIIPSKVKYQ